MAALMSAMGPRARTGIACSKKTNLCTKGIHRNSMREFVCRFDGSAYLNTATAEAERALGAFLAACRR